MSSIDYRGLTSLLHLTVVLSMLFYTLIYVNCEYLSAHHTDFIHK